MANIRTIDYQGFSAASSSHGPSGIMLWSGSISLTGSGDATGKDTTYDGIGIEAVQDSSSFLRYSSSAAGNGLEIRTNTFFLGSKDSGYISGSGDGTIAISSSNFHLDTLGAVEMQGTITATAGGTIGGWIIGSDFLSASNGNFLLDASTNGGGSGGQFHLSTSNFQIDTTGHITASGGTIGGFTITDTALSKGTTFRFSSSTNSDDPAGFISSSRFKVRSDGTLTASAAQIDGKITAHSGEIGGATIGDTSLSYGTSWVISSSANNTDPVSFISSSNFKVRADGVVTASAILLSGGTLDNPPYWKIDNSTNDALPAGFISSSGFKASAGGRITASAGLVGGWQIDANKITNFPVGTVGPGIKIGSTDDIISVRTGSGGTTEIVQLGELSSGNYGMRGYTTTGDEIFKLGMLGNQIAGWTFTNTSLYSGLVQLSASYGLKVSSSNDTYVELYHQASDRYGIVGKENGDEIFSLGDHNQIAGWYFDNKQITSSVGNSGLIISSSGTIQTSNFISSELAAGQGWRITSDGKAEFEHATIRGTLSTAVFEKDTISAVGGQVIIANATTITGSEGYEFLSADTVMSVSNAGGFAVNEFLVAKATSSTGFTREYLKVTATDATHHLLTVDRNQDGGGLIATMSIGQVIVSQGTTDTGYIHLNADPTDTGTPYIDVAERTGSAVGDVKLVARLGDLSGVSDPQFPGGISGYGLYTQNGFFKGKIEVGSLPTLPSNENCVLHVNFANGSGSTTTNQSQVDVGGEPVTTMSYAGLYNYGSGSNAITTYAFRGSVGQDSRVYNNNTWFADGSSALVQRSGSWSMWFKCNDVNGADEAQCIYEEGGTSGGVNLYVSNSMAFFNVYQSSGGNATTRILCSASIEDNTWYHAVGTTQRGGTGGITGSLYIDGVHKQTDEASGFNNYVYSGMMGIGAVQNDSNFAIEQANYHTISGNGKNYFTGSIDEVRVYYGQTLSESQVIGLYTNPQGTTPGSTIIEGNRIKTGVLQSNNWDASYGSNINLDDGIIKMGGSASPKFHWDGSTLSIVGAIDITGGTAGTALSNLSQATSSLNATTGSINSATSSLMNATASLNSATGSLYSATASFGAATASLYSATASLNSATGSLMAATASLNSATGSIYSATASLNTATGSLMAATASLFGQTAALALATGSLMAATASLTAAQADLMAATSSLYAFSASVNTATGSIPTDANGLIDLGGSPSGQGLYLTSEKMGFYDSSNWATLMSASGDFYLTGSHGYLVWDAENESLAISGSISASSGRIEGDFAIAGRIEIGALPNLPDESGLKGRWTFEDPSNHLKDYSGASHTADTGSSAELKLVPGPDGGHAAEFGDSQGMLLLEDSDIENDVYQSYTFWFKPSDNNTIPDADGRIITRDLSDHWGLIYPSVTTTPYDSNGASDLRWYYSSGAYVTITDAVISGSWHFFAMTYDYQNNMSHIYVYKPDSTLIHTSKSLSSPADPSGNADRAVAIACNSEASDTLTHYNSDNISGSYAEIRYYSGSDKVLSELEVHALWSTPRGNAGTKISGDGVTTGKIQSTNWSDTVGSEFNLNTSEVRLGGSTSPKLHWNPATSTLTVDGAMNITGGTAGSHLSNLSAATSSLNSTTGSLNSATGSLYSATSSLMAATASLNSATGSIYSATASFGAATASLNSATGSIYSATASLNSATGSLMAATASLFGQTAALQLATASLNATTGSLLTSVAAIPNDANGLIDLAGSPSGQGLYLTSTKLGFYDSSNFTTLMSSSGDFYLTGSNGYLVWDASEEKLNISGKIQVQNSPGSGFLANFGGVSGSSSPLEPISLQWNISGSNTRVEQEDGVMYMSSSNTADVWDASIRSKDQFNRKDEPTLIIDLTISDITGGQSSPRMMIGWGDAVNGTGDSYTSTAEAAYFTTNDLHIYNGATGLGAWPTGGSNNVETNKKYRITSTLNANGGAKWKMFKHTNLSASVAEFDTTSDGDKNTDEFLDVGVWCLRHQKTFHVDKMEVVPASISATVMDGGNIKTGKIQSTNWASNAGSELDLTAGTITLGGSDGQGTIIKANGQITASDIILSGSCIATNFASKVVTVKAGNLSSYRSQSHSNTKNYLVFDGSQGGERCLHMILDTDPGELHGFVTTEMGVSSSSEIILDITTTVSGFATASVYNSNYEQNQK